VQAGSAKFCAVRPGQLADIVSVGSLAPDSSTAAVRTGDTALWRSPWLRRGDGCFIRRGS
jgi:hypothetical protein